MNNKKMKEEYFQILKSLIKIPSPSGQEEELANIVENYCKNGWTKQRDNEHNILFCPGDSDKSVKLPLLYAHLDTHPNGKPTNHLLDSDNIISLDENGQITKGEPIQMGFDDKAGVAAILYLMHHTKLKFRALFVAQEEKSDLPKKYERNGGGGIEYAINHDLGWVFEESAYVLSLDRRNGNEVIAAYGDNDTRDRIPLCTPEFAQWIISCSEVASYPMAEAHSDNVADVYNIRQAYPNLNCVNLSIGYYDEHKCKESLKIDETLGVIKVLKECLPPKLPNP